MIEDVAALVMNDPDIGGEDILVVLRDGTLVNTRAKVTFLFSIRRPAQKRVLAIRPQCVDRGESDLPVYEGADFIVTAARVTYRILDTERVAGSIRFQLLPTEGRRPSDHDFRSQDFGGVDFAVD